MIYARICVNCMKEKPNVTGICPFCGFDAAKYHTPSHHLPLYTRLTPQTPPEDSDAFGSQKARKGLSA